MSAAPAAHPLAASALGWLARLPLLGEVELAQLLDAAELEVRMALHSLDRLGWSEWFVPGSPELAASRLAFVRSGATAELRDLLAVADEGLPLPRRDLLARIVRVEATVGINRLLAALAAELRMEASIELAEARALPSRAAAPRRWWPREVDVYGCLRAGALWAPFFVAWDRAAVPRAHRLRRLAAWAEFAATDRCWVPGGMPPVLLVCPDEEAVAEWGDALERRAERAGRVPHAMLAATATSVAEATGDAIWRHTAKLHGGALVEQLEWGSAPPAVTKCGTTTLPELHPIEIRERPLRERAPALATATSASTRSGERLAALALATDAEEKRLLEWIGRHPLLSLGELATLLERPPLTIERRLNWLQRCRLVDVIERCLEGERQPQRRFVITDVALQWLAARDGVPPRRYAKHGIVAARPDGDDATGTRLQGLLRHLDHSVGVNRAFARLAADARRAGLRLATWHNEAESTKRFRVDGRGYGSARMAPARSSPPPSSSRSSSSTTAGRSRRRSSAPSFAAMSATSPFVSGKAPLRKHPPCSSSAPTIEPATAWPRCWRSFAPCLRCSPANGATNETTRTARGCSVISGRTNWTGACVPGQTALEQVEPATRCSAERTEDDR